MRSVFIEWHASYGTVVRWDTRGRRSRRIRRMVRAARCGELALAWQLLVGRAFAARFPLFR